jgi:pSer/pThr/pTyr-binding forkhead associated (FHA) protein
MPKLTVSLPEAPATHDLTEAEITIGRVADNNIEIGDISVSSRHAVLRLDESGDYILTDIGSTNGTELNGRAIAPNEEHKLQDGDTIVFGKIEVSYASENPAEARPLPEAEEVAAVVAENSMRPADFANASPFQKKNKKKDPAGVGIYVLSVVAILVFGYAVSLIYSIKSPL